MSETEKSGAKDVPPGADFDGQVESLYGKVFQLSSERNKNSSPDQFDETKKALASWAIMNTGEEAGLINDMIVLMIDNTPAPYNLPNGYKTLDEDEKIKCNHLFKASNKTVKEYRMGKLKLLAAIIQQCSPKMKLRLEDLDNYDQMYIDRDVLGFLQIIRKLVHDDSRMIYLPASLSDAQGVLAVPQKHSDSLDDFLKVFQERVAAIKYVEPRYFHFPTLMAKDEGITEAEVYALYALDINKFNKIAQRVEEQVLATTFLRAVNRQRYSSYKTKIYNDMVDGVNNYPMTLASCVRNLELHQKS